MKFKSIIPVAVLVLGLGVNSLMNYVGSQNAHQFLNQMYNFSNVGAIDTRYEAIHELVTDDVYEEVTSLDRTLRAYLKMEGKPSTLEIVAEGDGYIIYTLDCDALTPGRKFMLIYESNIFGKLNKVREMEVADFI